MLTREMLVCLATSALLCFVVFFYFRNRLKTVEFKLNTLFQLIQDHVNKPEDRIEVKEKMEEMVDVSDDDSSVSDSESEAESEQPLVFDQKLDNLENIVTLSAAPEEDDAKSVEVEEIIELHGGPPHEEEEDMKGELSEESLFGFSVAVLKGIAAEKGFERYKSLRKPQLVELLLTGNK